MPNNLTTEDLAKTALVTDLSSLKILKEGSGNMTANGAGAYGTTYTTLNIPHGYGSDNLIYQVSVTSGYVSGTILPWSSNDGRLAFWAEIDATNLIIFTRLQDSGGGGFPGFSFPYSYRILIP